MLNVSIFILSTSVHFENIFKNLTTNGTMETLSQVIQSDCLLEQSSTPRTLPKVLRPARKDYLNLNKHRVQFVKCKNQAPDGTIINHNPTHGHVEVLVYCLKGNAVHGKQKAVLVSGINVILSCLPTERLKIWIVEIINFKIEAPNASFEDIYFYQTIVRVAILKLYDERYRIVTTSTDFDVGCGVQVGAEANKWFIDLFNLPRAALGIAVLREGNM